MAPPQEPEQPPRGLPTRKTGPLGPSVEPLNRYLALDAGPFLLALPLVNVRHILDLGGVHAAAPEDPRALGVTPVVLSRVLGTTPTTTRQGLFLLDGLSGPVLVAACRLHGVFDAPPPEPLPRTVACTWPGLLLGMVKHERARLVIDAAVLMGLIEVAQTEEAP